MQVHCISSDVCLPIYTIETLYVIKPTQLSAYAIIYNLKFKKIMPDEYSLLIDIKYRWYFLIYTWTCIVFICTYAACLELQITAQVRDFMEQIKL